MPHTYTCCSQAAKLIYIYTYSPLLIYPNHIKLDPLNVGRQIQCFFISWGCELHALSISWLDFTASCLYQIKGSDTIWLNAYHIWMFGSCSSACQILFVPVPSETQSNDFRAVGFNQFFCFLGGDQKLVKAVVLNVLIFVFHHPAKSESIYIYN